MSDSLPSNPTHGDSYSQRDAPKQDNPGFSRSGFAPIPPRHSDMSPPYNDAYDRDRGRLGRPDIPDDLDDRRYDRRPPPPRWEDDYDRPKRRRSPSPYNSAHRQRHHSPSPTRYGQGALPDPAELPNQITYRQFADWFRASHPQTAKADEEEARQHRLALEQGLETTKGKVGMSKRYDRYRKEFISRQLFALYLTHRDSPWFLERYSNSPTFVAQRRRVNRQGRVRTAENYLDELRAGKHDSLNFDFSADLNRRPSSSRPADEPEGLDRALGDADDQNSMRVEAAPSPGQVFVKTVPPSTGRKDIEELFGQVDGFQYLAMTEPAAKKGFHRVAWAQFEEGVEIAEVVRKLDGTRLDNFTFHLGFNGTPVVGKIRLTSAIANTLDRLVLDGEKARQLAIKLEDELVGDEDESLNVAEPKNGDEEKPLKRQEPAVPGLRERGSVIVQEKIDTLLEDAGLVGDLDDPQKIHKAKIVLDHWIGYLRYGLSTCYYCVASTAFPEELLRKCISHMRPRAEDTENSASVQHEKEDERREEEGEDRRDYDDDRGHREEGRGHRREKTTYFKTEEVRWRENIDSRLRSLLDPDVDAVEYGGRDLEEETKKLAAPFIKQEEASKYRCKECSKLFRAPEFVIKHISSKHPETIQAKLEDIAVFNNYVLDPQRVQPTSTTLAAINDELPSTLPFAAAAVPTFNPAFAGNGNGSLNAMQQQMMMMMQMQQAMMMAGAGVNGVGSGLGGGRGPPPGGFPDAAPGPPPGGEDPRAARGRVSYLDLDEPGGGGDGGLPY